MFTDVSKVILIRHSVASAVQNLPQSSLGYRRSTGAAGRRLRWPALTGSGAAACGSPPSALGLAKQTP